MANQIRMTPEVMRERAREYADQSLIVEQVISKMDGLLSQLESEWEGESSRSYVEKYEELRPGFEAAQELIMRISDALYKTAQMLEETDAAIAAGFRV